MTQHRARIERVHIKGFRSLADVNLDFRSNVTVLVGANGSGKSNFIRFFEMVRWMLKSRDINDFVMRQGGADDQLFGGARRTPGIEATLRLTINDLPFDYHFSLARTDHDQFVFSRERFRLADSHYDLFGARVGEPWVRIDGNFTEAKIAQYARTPVLRKDESHSKAHATVLVHLLTNCVPFHFHDTSAESRLHKPWDIGDGHALRTDGGNLGAVLYRLERHDNRRYETICRQIRRVLPTFERFSLEEYYGRVSLRWIANWTDKSFGSHLTSDGSLRLFALVTLLNLPPESLPHVVFLDEPELGLHPAGLEMVASMMRRVGRTRQLVVATQSTALVDQFELEQIVALDLVEGRTEPRAFESERFREWLDDDYQPGELWLKNLLGGRP